MASATFGAVGNVPFQFTRLLSNERERLEWSLPVTLPKHSGSRLHRGLGAQALGPSRIPSGRAEPGPHCHLPPSVRALPALSTRFFLVTRKLFYHLSSSYAWEAKRLRH